MDRDPAEMMYCAMLRGRLAALLLLALVCSASPAGASSSLPQPAGQTVLVIDGAISNRNSGGAAAFDLAMLQSMPQVELKTVTAWTNGMQVFKGVRLRDLLDAVGAEGTTLTASAIDEYQVPIPVSDAADYNVIVAYEANGKPLPVDDKGPLWIVYPFSDMPKLQRDFFFARCVWQLRRLTVQ
jgi:hypothetical protein